MKKKKIILRGYVTSHIGLKKPSNEDNYLLASFINEKSASVLQHDAGEEKRESWCAGIFDGMGGGQNGEKASLLTARQMKKTFEEISPGSDKEAVENKIRKGFLDANMEIAKLRKSSPVLGTTATVLYKLGEEIKIFHLGDSRVYLLREGRLYQLTRDQTLATLKAEAGYYELGSEAADMDSHMLTEFVGADETLISLRPLESDWIQLQAADKLLLCTDGLYRDCTAAQIRKLLLSGGKPELLAEQLLQQALDQGGKDNITAMVLVAEEAG